MKRTTIFIDESLEHELHALARSRRMPVAAVMRESFARYLEEQKRGRGMKLRFLGRGRSGQKNVAERHEELLWGGLAPHGGKVRPRHARDR